MKINQLLLKIILIAILFILCSSCISYANESDPATEEPSSSSEVTGDETKGLPSLGEGYKPQPDMGTTAIDIISLLLGVMTVLGIISIVIAIALIGFGTILGSASDKAVAQEKYVGILIAALLLTGGSALARMIISVAENIA